MPLSTPSQIKLTRANVQAHVDSMRERSAAIRAQAGLKPGQLAKIKPMSDALKAKLADHTKFGRK